MIAVNVPLEMISRCNTLGEIVPIKFKIENAAHEMLVAKVEEVIYQKESNFAGMRSFEYGCKIHLEGREQLLEISYQVAHHKWMIKKVVYG